MPHRPSTVPPALALLIATTIGLVPSPPPSYAACGANVPADTVPRCRLEAGVDCSIWPVDPVSGLPRFFPASVIRSQRDSTGWTTTVKPNAAQGFEFFRDIAFPGNRNGAASASDYAYVAYTGGLSIWSLREAPHDPRRAVVRDIWSPSPWFVGIDKGEVDEYLNALDVMEARGQKVRIGIAARDGIGVSLWTFDTRTEKLEQIFQHTDANAQEIRLVEFAGRALAFVATAQGVSVYDIDAADRMGACASSLGDVTVDCPGVFLGRVGNIVRSSALDVRVGDGELFVATVDSEKAGVEIWRLTDPDRPEAAPRGSARRHFRGLHPTSFAPRLFDYRGRTFLAVVEDNTVSSQGRTMAVYDASGCMEAPCASLARRHAFEQLTVTNSSTSFLTLTFRDDAPYLYYGFSGPFVGGTGHERLWSLAGLPRVFAADTLPEVTDGGDTYTDPCNGTPGVDYFADYYHGNAYGLHRFSPRHGRFNGPYFYRTARSIFDIHGIRGAPQTGGPLVETVLVSKAVPVSKAEVEAAPRFAFGKEIDFTALVSHCTPGFAAWCWNRTDTPGDVTVTPSAPCSAIYGQNHSVRFTCDRSSRCEDTEVTIAAWNDGCGPADEGSEIATAVVLVDPRLFADGFESGSLDLWHVVRN